MYMYIVHVDGVREYKISVCVRERERESDKERVEMVYM